MKSRRSLAAGLVALVLLSLAPGALAAPEEDGGCWLPPRFSLLCEVLPGALEAVLARVSASEGEPGDSPATDPAGPTVGGAGVETTPGEPSPELRPTIDPTG